MWCQDLAISAEGFLSEGSGTAGAHAAETTGKTEQKASETPKPL